MSAVKKRISFFQSEEGERSRNALQAIADDIKYNTESTYSADAILHPDQLISFVDKHMNYLNAHLAIDPVQYISNLRLMTRLK